MSKDYVDIPILLSLGDASILEIKTFFNLCTSICRTSSFSVNNEKFYKPDHRYCFGITAAPISVRLVDVTNENNNSNNSISSASSMDTLKTSNVN